MTVERGTIGGAAARRCGVRAAVYLGTGGGGGQRFACYERDAHVGTLESVTWPKVERWLQGDPSSGVPRRVRGMSTAPNPDAPAPLFDRECRIRDVVS